MLKVIVPGNIRIVEDSNTDLQLISGEEYELNERQLRSLPLRFALIDGRLRVTEGEVTFPFRNSYVEIIGKPGGNETIIYRNGDEAKVVPFDPKYFETAKKIANLRARPKAKKKPKLKR